MTIRRGIPPASDICWLLKHVRLMQAGGTRPTRKPSCWRIFSHPKLFFQEKIKYKQLKDELDKLQDKGDLQSGRVSDLKQKLHTTKEQLSHYQEETRRLDKEVSQLQSQLSEEQVIHKRLSMYFKRLLHFAALPRLWESGC